MARIEFDAIDDATVERFLNAQSSADWNKSTAIERVRAGLKAALTRPPPEPEIPVSEGMKRAAVHVLIGKGIDGRHPHEWDKDEKVWLEDLGAETYRAMERERLRGASEISKPDGSRHRHARADNIKLGGNPVPVTHRRASDSDGGRTSVYSHLPTVIVRGLTWRMHRRSDEQYLYASPLIHRRKDDPK